MDLRDAVEADADRLADLTDTPRDVMVNLVHDRTVRVAVDSTVGADEDEGDIRGFVSYDARADTVHVTQIEGDGDACNRLLEEPIRFAEREGMAVEVLVPEDETDTRDVAEAAGFEAVGSGPTFEGRPTVRLRLDPATA
jgi:hypothetical protein